jgi:hypothetical protein
MIEKSLLFRFPARAWMDGLGGSIKYLDQYLRYKFLLLQVLLFANTRRP